MYTPGFLRVCGESTPLIGVFAKPFGGVAMMVSSAWQTATQPLQCVSEEQVPGNDYRSCFRGQQDQGGILMPIMLDTGASTSITPVLEGFVGPLEASPADEITRLSGKTRIVGKGTVEWAISNYWNVVCVVRTTAYYNCLLCSGH